MAETTTGAQGVSAAHTHDQQDGVSLRDRFAMAALQGLLSDATRAGSDEMYALRAWRIADAMLAAREVVHG